MKKALLFGVMAFLAINLVTIQNANAQKPEKKVAAPSSSQTVNERPSTTNNVANVPARPTTTTSEMGNVANTTTNPASTNNTTNRPVQMTTTTSEMGNATNVNQSGKTTLGTTTATPASTNNTTNRPVQMSTTTSEIGNATNAVNAGRRATLGTASNTDPTLSVKPQNIKAKKQNMGDVKNGKNERKPLNTTPNTNDKGNVENINIEH